MDQTNGNLQEIDKLRKDLCMANSMFGVSLLLLVISVGFIWHTTSSDIQSIHRDLTLVNTRYNMDKKRAMVMHMTISSQKYLTSIGGVTAETNNSCVITAWSVDTNQDFAQLNNDGMVYMIENGTYLIYIQISYSQKRGQFSFSVFIGAQEFVKCTWTEWGAKNESLHACHTSSVTKLHQHQILSVRYWYPDSNLHVLKASTFWGLVKLA